MRIGGADRIGCENSWNIREYWLYMYGMGLFMHMNLCKQEYWLRICIGITHRHLTLCGVFNGFLFKFQLLF